MRVRPARLTNDVEAGMGLLAGFVFNYRKVLSTMPA